MSRTVWIGAVVVLTSVVATGFFLLREPSDVSVPKPAAIATDSVPAATQATERLYCEFTNFADRTPRVGFYFAREVSEAPAYGLLFQREQDGTQADFGEDGSDHPRWALDVTENPAVLRSPNKGIAINLYDFDLQKQGTAWFEAGLRSIQYLNLGGRCRLSST